MLNGVGCLKFWQFIAYLGKCPLYLPETTVPKRNGIKKKNTMLRKTLWISDDIPVLG